MHKLVLPSGTVYKVAVLSHAFSVRPLEGRENINVNEPVFLQLCSPRHRRRAIIIIIIIITQPTTGRFNQPWVLCLLLKGALISVWVRCF
jgi:hypothetical protein